MHRLARGVRHSAAAIALVSMALGSPLTAQAPAQAPATTTGVALTVTATLATAPTGGEIGCALYKSGDGFPSDPAHGLGRFVPAAATVTCRFDGLAPGRYAVAVFHDTNGNQRSDRNFVGMPTEAWGVSNNVRHAMRAPRFEEAAVEVADRDVAIAIALRR